MPNSRDGRFRQTTRHSDISSYFVTRAPDAQTRDRSCRDDFAVIIRHNYRFHSPDTLPSNNKKSSPARDTGLRVVSRLHTPPCRSMSRITAGKKANCTPRRKMPLVVTPAAPAQLHAKRKIDRDMMQPPAPAPARHRGAAQPGARSRARRKMLFLSASPQYSPRRNGQSTSRPSITPSPKLLTLFSCALSSLKAATMPTTDMPPQIA